MFDKTNAFEIAARKQMRFQFRGLIRADDLFSLSKEDLDNIYVGLRKELNAATEESLLKPKASEEADLQIKIAIVKYVYDSKVEEAESRKKDRERLETKKQILAIIAEKQSESLRSKSIEDLAAMLDKL